MPTALFIGRFQPLHLGHLSVIQRALSENEHLYIGIGSAENNFRPANPLTTSERIQLLRAALNEIGAPTEKYTIIPVPNINNFALWPAHLELYIPPFNKIYTGSDVVMNLFDEYNKNRKNPYEIIHVKKDLQISSTEIRDRILRKRQWQKFLPLAVSTLLQSWNIENRILAGQEAEK